MLFRSVSILSAFAKTGKSELAYRLAIAISRGEPFLGRAALKGPVLIVAVEEHGKHVRRRLMRYGHRPSDQIYVHVGRAGDPEAAIRDIQKTVERMSPKPVLILLDTLTRFWGIEDENDSRETSPHLELWTDLARATDVHVMLAHHDNKSGGAYGRQIRGSGDILSAVDYALMLNRLPNSTIDDPRRILTTIGRYEEPVPEMLLAYEASNGYRLVDGPVPKIEKVRTDPKCDEFKTKFPDGPDQTIEDVAELLDVDRRAARRLIDKGVGEGWLVKGEKKKPEGKGGRWAETWRRQS